jgi:hypothetical protein
MKRTRIYDRGNLVSLHGAERETGFPLVSRPSSLVPERERGDR